MSDFMDDEILRALKATRLVPLVQAEDAETAVRISGALIDGGLRVLEVVLRTDEALECLEAIVARFPDAHVGAGTVLSAAQVTDVIGRGAAFVVSPGLDETSVETAQEAGVAIFPGVATSSELQRAFNLGLRTVKFFPASLAGGPEMLQAFSAVFRDMQFMPTGGVSATNLTRYLEIPSVVACGGSWLTPADAISAGDFAAITKLATEARAIAQQ